MAELAPGAVNALLGIIRNEAQLLGGVENDVQFIKEEMESMNSFLQHLARTKPPGGEHDDQVRTWMKQVRDLAYACSSCIDTYLRRGDPAAVRAARVRMGNLWWVSPWYLQKLYAQHRAATKLRELKDQARDVGERRLRYGVEIPTSKKTTTTSLPLDHEATSPSQTQAAGGGDEGIIPGVDERTPEDEAMRAQVLSEPRLLEECTRELVRWLRYAQERAPYLEDPIQSIAIAAPDAEDGADVAREALAHPLVTAKFEHKFWITSEYKSYGVWIIEPLDILRHIQQNLHGEQEQKPEKEIDTKIKEITEKIEDYLGAGKRSCTFIPLEPLDILHHILAERLPKDPVDATDTSVKVYQMDKMITETAEKLKVHLEKGKEKSWIGLDHSEYEGILRELLPHPKEDKPIKEATDKLDEKIRETFQNIKEIMKKMIEDILQELKPHEDKSVKEATDDKLREVQTAENIKEATQTSIEHEDQIKEAVEKIKGTLLKIKERLQIKEAWEMIKGHLKDKTTLIVLDGHDDVHTWGKIKKVLNMLGCADDSAVRASAMVPSQLSIRSPYQHLSYVASN